ncbi:MULTISPECIES: hypothetical protein [Haloferax]|uniref:Uncharacterized protein n=1 Tax=Haloferax marinum TaxID=2666143 RepID=A0A6A8G990_9EURY|nr:MULTISPECIES: hypothetical protein [Haloferax]KAB1198358.1 hypothetical protein Hfx1150_12880 [Haloferax sp. CBA1150]MRW97457.1 hypothetical protein [Haloferax marinum]
MTHDNELGLPDPRDQHPSGIVTLADTVFVALATIVGVLAAALAATLVAPLAPGLGLVTLFVGWPLGLVLAVFVLRTGAGALVRSGIPASVRTVIRRGRTPKRVVPDGGTPDETASRC